MGADKPSLEKIHGFLFLSLHEWGSGRGATAFIYIGLAIRVGLLLRSFRKQTPLAPPFNKPVETREEFVVEETRVRTWWSMNSMECLLASGQNRTALTTYSETAEIGMPCREEAFVWGDVSSLRHLTDSAEPSEKESLILAVRHWSTINCWVSSGGVKKESHPPWSPLSRFAELQGVLRSWREQLPPKLQYDQTFFVMHAVNKQTGPYGFLHLVYFSSVIFLHREYLQFFPVQGPTYRGRLPKGLDQAYEGIDVDAFWTSSLKDLFNAAARITEILVELERHDAVMLTPFLGFAAFSAATVNMYLAIFSWVYPDLAAGARERTETDVRFLKQVVGLWPLAQQWYQTVLRLYESYKQFHMDGGAPESPSGKTIDAFHSFDRSLMDYGEIKPEPDDMAAIVAAKDTDGYKHGTELKYPRSNEDNDDGLQGIPQFGEEGYWDTVADEFLSSIMTFDAPITMS
ncbi:putative c6 transcription factor protein [Phaeoacremonium minimum UCRPA7]|uniref:Putative c6 transcription factor protein n=1 Tax=Phaeoacremonium minimum (strain UCR-PA7) TaxID=1286976 RepID=R8BPK2_PHAM7|nr:putative c6 transcription factor protein [Phaeoacremonium minimum UCRPA7]EOO01271.1 putative c6 transcription factor protein [Phaeoacremonium minimum UCRPA7]